MEKFGERKWTDQDEFSDIGDGQQRKKNIKQIKFEGKKGTNKRTT